MYRYYLKRFPISNTPYPPGHTLTKIIRFRNLKYVREIHDLAYGYVEFASRLSDAECYNYDLKRCDQ